MDDAFDTNWKGNYTKREKMRTCINNLFKQNLKDLKEFNFNEIVCKTEVSDGFKSSCYFQLIYFRTGDAR